MKKFMLLAIVLLGLTIDLVACTEETIAPADQHNGGGWVADPK